MSAFLGPIHYWLFAKIVTVESRAHALAALLSDKGVDVADLLADYGEKLQGADLAELVGGASIHQFLSGLITKVEVFEAQVVERGGDDHFELLLATAQNHGRVMGSELASDGGGPPSTAESLANFIHNHALEGMPCDPGGDLAPLSDTELSYGHQACNHMMNWRYTGVDLAKMCRIQNAWVEGLTKGLCGNVTYVTGDTIVSGAPHCQAQITLG